ncbi:archease [Candidatus Microgenomates bacterium]|nr:archease [Candidatus Microgenomates bacterium]
MPNFRFLPEIATADIAFEAFGRTQRQLLENAARALEEAMVDTKTLRNREKEVLNLREGSLSELLFSLLEHLVFLKNAKQLLFKDIKLGVTREGKSWVIQGFAYGERIDPKKHKLKVDVKAPTKRLYEVGKTKTGMLRAQVILDI